jgi:hypothetical protein
MSGDRNALSAIEPFTLTVEEKKRIILEVGADPSKVASIQLPEHSHMELDARQVEYLPLREPNRSGESSGITDIDIDKILQAVGWECELADVCQERRDRVKAALANFDSSERGAELKAELKADINAAWDFYQGYERESSKSQSTARRKYAKNIADSAKALACLLDGRDSDACDCVRVWVDVRLPAFRAELSMVQDIERVFERRETMRERTLGVSSTDQFLGHDLLEVYKAYFGETTARDRDTSGGKTDGQLIGPWIRFAKVVSECLGTDWGEETVSKAMTNIRKCQAVP